MPNESMKNQGKCLFPQTRILTVTDDETNRGLADFTFTVTSFTKASPGVLTLNSTPYWAPGQKVRTSGVGTAPVELIKTDYYTDLDPAAATNKIILKTLQNVVVDTTDWESISGANEFTLTPMIHPDHYIVTMRTTHDIRYRYDGGFLSKAVGCLLKAGESICLLIDPNNLKIVRGTDGEAPVVTITLEG